MYPYLLRIPLPWGGSFTLASYGLSVLCGFLLAVFVARKRGQRAGVDPNALFDMCIAMLIGGIVGARIFYVFYDWSFFRSHPLEAFRIDKGGLVFFGGLIGGGVVMFYVLSKKRMPVRRALDIVISVVPLGHVFGRIGCFLNGCCFGRITQSWVGIRFPRILEPGSVREALYNVDGQHIIGSPPFVEHLHYHYLHNLPGVLKTELWSQPVHPTQLYEAGYNLVIFAVLSLLLWRRRREGDIAWLYAVLYGTARFFNEFLRGDQSPMLWKLTIAQIICVPLVVFGLVMLVRSSRLPREPFAEPWRTTENAANSKR